MLEFEWNLYLEAKRKVLTRIHIQSTDELNCMCYGNLLTVIMIAVFYYKASSCALLFAVFNLVCQA